MGCGMQGPVSRSGGMQRPVSRSGGCVHCCTALPQRVCCIIPALHPSHASLAKPVSHSSRLSIRLRTITSCRRPYCSVRRLRARRLEKTVSERMLIAHMSLAGSVFASQHILSLPNPSLAERLSRHSSAVGVTTGLIQLSAPSTSHPHAAEADAGPPRGPNARDTNNYWAAIWQSVDQTHQPWNFVLQSRPGVRWRRQLLTGHGFSQHKEATDPPGFPDCIPTASGRISPFPS
ncbi:uncharacterized protein CC84DRAFT_520077 [Paraphaeosphaeria sporulosa]|uniref:Uncharacterized protein n=1 Tax=Paraphaeosphaeria sporulosa TaxID=1460663 RepID=A0A177BT07_9PLEO|nr:uncharacterized protein CC84DRAFT_520077 [Paraphaeosphaeria sporulosa]OAF98513.1 hypothetical protein CC84DRAFT_520077 [Paraphaeosphaeria sporulosa]